MRALLLMALSTFATTVLAADQVTSPQTKARTIQLIDTLERDPFVANGREIRGDMLGDIKQMMAVATA